MAERRVIAPGDRVRRFIRFYAGHIAAMEPDPRPYPPAALRVIDELTGRESTELRSLRHALRIDPGWSNRRPEVTTWRPATGPGGTS